MNPTRHGLKNSLLESIRSMVTTDNPKLQPAPGAKEDDGAASFPG
jgi:hypothetical protein